MQASCHVDSYLKEAILVGLLGRPLDVPAADRTHQLHLRQINVSLRRRVVDTVIPPQLHTHT